MMLTFSRPAARARVVITAADDAAAAALSAIGALLAGQRIEWSTRQTALAELALWNEVAGQVRENCDDLAS